MKFSDKLLNLRKNQGLSKAELAQKLGVSEEIVGKWELGVETPDDGQMSQIAQIFNVTVADLTAEKAESAKTSNKAPKSGTAKGVLIALIIIVLLLLATIITTFIIMVPKFLEERDKVVNNITVQNAVVNTVDTNTNTIDANSIKNEVQNAINTVENKVNEAKNSQEIKEVQEAGKRIQEDIKNGNYEDASKKVQEQIQKTNPDAAKQVQEAQKKAQEAAAKAKAQYGL